MLDDRNATKPRNMSFKTYKKMKYTMLTDFQICISEEEKQHFDSLTTEVAVDNFCIDMIKKYL